MRAGRSRAAAWLLAAGAACRLATASAWASPFCLSMPDGANDCRYEDAADCVRAASLQHAACGINPAEISLKADGPAACLVDNSRTPECLYASFAQCTRAAAPRHGFCVDLPAPDLAQGGARP